MTTLYVQDSIGSYIPASDEQIIQAAYAVTEAAFRRGPALANPRATREYLLVRYRALPHEIFGVMFLDNRNRVIAVEEMFRGTIDGAAVHPREVVKATLQHNAASVVFFHNHPTGVPEPSQADEMITRRLKEALALIDVRVLDHLIVGQDFVESFSERGLL